MNHPPSRIITLATDFGTRDSYVATMKGVIHRIHPSATTVDLTHQVEAQDLMEASLVLDSCYRFFPLGTVHLVVVDPGVGTKRRPILVDTPDHLFVGPDNGVFSRIYASQDIWEAREITNQDFLLPQISDTFHGRDVFAPVGAHLSRGIAPSEFGPLLKKPVRRDLPQPTVWPDQIVGEVIHIDSFGNVITNVTRETFERVVGDRSFRIILNGRVIQRISRSYQEVERGRALALFDSLNMLEIAIHGGRADRRIGAGKGDQVQVHAEPA